MRIQPGRGRTARRRAIGMLSAACGLAVLAGARADDSALAEVTVTAERLELIGAASTASEGVVVTRRSS